MSEFIILIHPSDPKIAKSQLQSWLNRNVHIYEILDDEDLILDEILADSGTIKHQYRIRKSRLDKSITQSGPFPQGRVP